ncbi:tetratricopeptide repeat protein [Pontibacter beigongshangensis]|uniref:tetratricopeptide repeat protein n=1 Tax=Pontibacter beigongshangensis TaxID=2574733 RepID=UPI00164FD2C8|nr:tetratricopeptide repeat protein [Pontibacter beigongshangensis]
MKKIILSVLFILASTSQLLAQGKNKVEETYAHALQLFEQQQTEAAVSEFKKVIVLNPRHKDAIYNLAVINFELGNKEEAVELLQACVRLRDRDAANLLKEQLQQKITYADTMHFEDVDVVPNVVVNSINEYVIDGKGLNKTIEKSILSELKKSKVLRKQFGAGAMLPLSLYFGKDGKLNAEILGPKKSEAAQQEITEVFNKAVQIVPGKHEGKEVVVWGLTLPVTM